MRTVYLFLLTGVIIVLGVGVTTVQVRQRMEPLLPVLPVSNEVNLPEADYLLARTIGRIAQTTSDVVHHLIQNRTEPGRDPP